MPSAASPAPPMTSASDGAPAFYDRTMAWNEKGDVLIAGSRVRHGDAVVWHAAGVRCGQ